MFNKVRNVILSCLGIIVLATTFIISTPSGIASSPDNFKYAIKVVMEHEGGLSNDRSDPGGITKYGISLRFLRSEHICIDNDCSDSPEEIIHLTQTQADEIYFKEFWLRYHYNQIKDKVIATKAFDSCVNMGASRANKLIKKAINKIISEPIAIDSTLDIETISIINNINSELLHEAMKTVEKEFYKSIVDRNHALIGFERGWLKRAEW